MIGYNFLMSGDRQLALAVLEWNAAKYPHSANAQDSWAEALEADKQLDRARAATLKAQQLLDGDSSLEPDRRELIRKGIVERLSRLKQDP